MASPSKGKNTYLLSPLPLSAAGAFLPEISLIFPFLIASPILYHLPFQMSTITNMSDTLRVNEIFKSIQGESSRAGLPCVLVRLAGCNLECTWCDTQYARGEEGRTMTIEEILEKVATLGCPRVELTGGEPLVQPNATKLLDKLCEGGYEVLLETNGSLDVSKVNEHVRRIIDVKCPASGQVGENFWKNLEHLTGKDEVKFVIADREDYDFACQIVKEHDLTDKCNVIFSPVWSSITGSTLARWILADCLDVRLGVQLHKIIWPEEDQGV